MCLWFYCGAWIKEQQLAWSLFCHCRVRSAGHRMMYPREREGKVGFVVVSQIPDKRGNRWKRGRNGQWRISTFWHGEEGGKGMSTRILELSKNESTNRALNIDERRQHEKRKNSSSARALSSHSFRKTEVCIWGSGNMQMPCPVVSVWLTLWTPSSALQKAEKGTTAKLFFGHLVISEFSHSWILKFYLLPEVCLESHKTSKSKLPLQIQLSESWTYCYKTMGPISELKPTEQKSWLAIMSQLSPQPWRYSWGNPALPTTSHHA